MDFGLIEFSRFLIDNGIEILAVATLEEALELRKNNIIAQILMLSSTSIKEEMEELIKNDITLTIGSNSDIEVLEELSISYNKEIKVHLKIDSGFGRYGFIYTDYDSILKASKELRDMKNVKLEGIYSHFSESYTKNNKWTNGQFERFTKIIEFLNANNIDFELKHICNSAAFLNYRNMHLNAARIGSAFLGRVNINEVGLKKIGIIKSNITEIKNLPKGYNVGYLNTYRTKKETTVAFVQFGYIQGYNLNRQQDMFRFIDKLRYLKQDLKNILIKQRLVVKINEKRYDVIGRLGMYHLAIDITKSDVKLNDIVYLEINPFYVDSKIRREYV